LIEYLKLVNNRRVKQICLVYMNFNGVDLND